jgi:PhnB protein
MSDVSSADTVRHTVTPHLVVRDAGAASAWYQRALGAQERGRIPVPGGRFMQIELRFGDSTVMIADEFPELDVLSPRSVGGTVGALVIHTDEVDALWRRGLKAGAKVSVPLQEMFWGRSSRGDLRPVRAPMGARPTPPRRPGRPDQGGGSGDVRRRLDLTLAKGGSHQRKKA